MLQSTRLRAARSSAARNRAFFTWARNAIGSGPLPGADSCPPAPGASASNANARVGSPLAHAAGTQAAADQRQRTENSANDTAQLSKVPPPVREPPAHRPQRVRG